MATAELYQKKSAIWGGIVGDIENQEDLVDYIEEHGGGGGTSNYNNLSNKPSINNVELSGNKTLAQIGAGTYSKPSGGIPKTDLASAVQTSLSKADSALQAVPSTYRTASAQDTIDTGKIDKPSNPATGAFLVWNGSAWVAQTLQTWQGGSY